MGSYLAKTDYSSGIFGTGEFKALNEQLEKDPVVVYSKTTCEESKKVKALLDKAKVDYTSYEINLAPPDAFFPELIALHTGRRTTPQVFVCKKFIGGFHQLEKLAKDKDRLSDMIKACSNDSNLRTR